MDETQAFGLAKQELIEELFKKRELNQELNKDLPILTIKKEMKFEYETKTTNYY